MAATIAVLLANLAAHRLASSAHLVIGPATALALAVIARRSGLTPDELGLTRACCTGRSTGSAWWPSGPADPCRILGLRCPRNGMGA